MKETHIGLVIIDENNRLQGAKYMLSKWERDLGDTLTIDGRKWRVGIIGDDRNSVIEALNKIIKIENSLTRRENKIANAKANSEFNRAISEALKNFDSIFNS